MRHRVAGRHLGRNAAQRRALFRNLVRELYLHERIITTEAKARSIRSDAERLITKAKKGASAADYRIHAQRQVVAYLNDKTVAKKVFDTFAPRYASRPASDRPSAASSQSAPGVPAAARAVRWTRR